MNSDMFDDARPGDKINNEIVDPNDIQLGEEAGIDIKGSQKQSLYESSADGASSSSANHS